ncbi:sugar ABC transporter permease [Faecalicatena contorta]|jgi:ABC-type sugar transport system permease subunit|uniref:carbohydrate ABC transporter permease n=1 Tax=Faecalicatena contorta TaxID=39482 RepID=UPI0031D8F48C
MNSCYKSKKAVFIFAAPALLIFTVFVVYPLIPELFISFQKHDGFQSHGFVGLQNYIDVLKSSSFQRANLNTFIIVLLSIFVALPVSLMFALVIDRQTARVRNFFKFTSVFPAILSVTVISQMWIAIYEPQWGLMNTLLRNIGASWAVRSWLSEKGLVIICIAFTFLWQYIGLNCLLFYAGIKSIPRNYYEAAQMDGAGFWKASLTITIPLLKDVIKYVFTISTLGSMGMFAYVRVMTSGGPGDLSRTAMYQMYYLAFSTSEFGKGSAIAILFIIECLVVTLIINKIFKDERVEY